MSDTERDKSGPLRAADAKLTDSRLGDMAGAGSERSGLLVEAVQAANNCICVADPKRDDCPLIYINDGFERTTGYDAEATLDRNCRFLQDRPADRPERDYLPGYDARLQERARAALRHGLERQEPCVALLHNFRRDGTPFWNELYLTPIVRDGEMIAVIGVQNDVTERVLAEVRVLDVQTREQERLARDLHDTVAQDLQALALRAELIKQALAEGGDPAEIAEDLDALIEAGHDAATEARLISHRLLPVGGDDDAETALAKLARRSADVWGIDVRFDHGGPALVASRDAALHLCRIAQEAIANAVRHGQADRVELRLDNEEVLDDGGQPFTFTARNNGRPVPDGFDSADGQAGIGLRGMRSRARLIGGRLDVANDAGETLVRVRVKNPGGERPDKNNELTGDGATR